MKITKSEFIVSNSDARKCPAHQLPEYAFIGRSNVGKSSLINMLAARKGLALTSAKPGKTMLINHFLINGAWYLVDLPGYGYARRGKASREKLRRLIEDYVLERRQMTNLFVLIDCRHEAQQIDLEFIEWLGEHGIPFSIVFTKADKLSTSKLHENLARYKNTLLQGWEALPPIFVTSSQSALGRDALLDYIAECNKLVTSS